MPLQHPDPGEVAAASNVRRWYDTGEGDRVIAVIGKPPRPQLELRHGRRIEERRPMQISQRVKDVVIGRIDDTNFVHETARLREIA